MILKHTLEIERKHLLSLFFGIFFLFFVFTSGTKIIQVTIYSVVINIYDKKDELHTKKTTKKTTIDLWGKGENDEGKKPELLTVPPGTRWCTFKVLQTGAHQVLQCLSQTKWTVGIFFCLFAFLSNNIFFFPNCFRSESTELFALFYWFFFCFSKKTNADLIAGSISN